MIGVGRGRGSIEGTFACVLIDADRKSALEDQTDQGSPEVLANTPRVHTGVEEVNDEYVLEPTIIWRVPLLDPARWEAIIGALWWTIVVALTLRLTLVIVVHDDENDDEVDEEGKVIEGKGEKEKREKD